VTALIASIAKQRDAPALAVQTLLVEALVNPAGAAFP
jgi:hypothetical protein